MAYDYYISRVSHIPPADIKKFRVNWFNCWNDKNFKKVNFKGEIDQYALFTKAEILERAREDEFSKDALEYVKNNDDAVYLVSAVWWESGLD